MKKMLCLLCALLMMVSIPAYAQEDLTQYAIATATVQAARHVDLVAPYSGTLDLFDLTPGDKVEANEIIFRMKTNNVYATEAGKVSAIFANKGDDAQAVMQRYGGVMGIEPTTLYQLQCTTDAAYNAMENKLIHLGETVYFRNPADSKEKCEGRVVQVQGGNFVVDMGEGEFKLGDSISVYRSNNYAARQCIGKGMVTRRNDVLLSGMGRVADMFVEEGDDVTAGQLLMTLMGADATPDAVPYVRTAEPGVVSSVQVAPGQQVWKGQVLCRIELTAEMEVVADVDEMDLNGLEVGDKVLVTIDMCGDEIFTGKVTEISSLGITKQNAAYYTVRVSIPEDVGSLGASASVYLPME